MRFEPMGDGYTHINVYGQSRVQLGRDLSNFAPKPLEMDGLLFACVEAWWYWQSLVAYGFAGHNMVTLRGKIGVEAKALGRELHGLRMTIPPTRQVLMTAYRAKLARDPDLRVSLTASTLPFDHYYVYNGERRDTKWQWTGVLWGDIRSELQRPKGG